MQKAIIYTKPPDVLQIPRTDFAGKVEAVGKEVESLVVGIGFWV
jgi:NADPH:quinone reductase-like Zn-dependent oxidoreductase